jgi:DNA-binding NtrC family response regulator
MAAKAIAIIDDEVDLVNLFHEALKNNGFKVCSFTDSIEAFNYIKRNLNDYGLILSDYRLPSMDGNELCTKLISINPELKVILMSAYDNIKYDSSKFTFIRKPIKISNLITIVKGRLAETSYTTI